MVATKRKNKMNIKGILKVKGETVRVSEKFSKREIVVIDNSNSAYPQPISLQLVNDKCSLVDNIAIGSEIDCSINLRGREWTSPQGEVKYFNTIECWKVSVNSIDKANQNAKHADNAVNLDVSVGSDESGLPF